MKTNEILVLIKTQILLFLEMILDMQYVIKNIKPG